MEYCTRPPFRCAIIIDVVARQIDDAIIFILCELWAAGQRSEKMRHRPKLHSIGWMCQYHDNSLIPTNFSDDSLFFWLLAWIEHPLWKPRSISPTFQYFLHFFSLCPKGQKCGGGEKRTMCLWHIVFVIHLNYYRLFGCRAANHWNCFGTSTPRQIGEDRFVGMAEQWKLFNISME